jgi:hypothetical protein
MQPYVPAYRIAFFESLISSMAADGVDVSIAAGMPDKTQQSRGDSVTPSWLRQIRSRTVQLGSRSIDLSDHRKVWDGSDAVIVGLVGSSVDSNLAVLQSIRRKRKVGLWGHAKVYVSEPNQLDALVERWQMRHADHIFAYTQIGADFAASVGVPESRITAVMNTIDTASLQTACDSLRDTEIAEFSRHHDLKSGKVLAFIGGLDASKRVLFLADFLDVLYQLDPEVKLLVGGQGEEMPLLNEAAARRQVILLGYVDNRQKALIGRTASAIVSPGRIGLVAVEGLLLGLPIVTTAWPYHAPEVDFLSEGDSRLTGPNDSTGFAAFVCDQLGLFERQGSVAGDWTFPTLEMMVDNFRTGVVSMLNS